MNRRCTDLQEDVDVVQKTLYRRRCTDLQPWCCPNGYPSNVVNVGCGKVGKPEPKHEPSNASTAIEVVRSGPSNIISKNSREEITKTNAKVDAREC